MPPFAFRKKLLACLGGPWPKPGPLKPRRDYVTIE
jgi:hypothetical protein